MSARDLRSELAREEALRQEQGMPPAARARVRARLNETIARRENGGRSRRTVWVVAAAACVAMLVLVVWSRSGDRTAGGFLVEQQSADFAFVADAEAIRIDDGQATLTASEAGITFENHGPLALRRERGGVRVVRGEAEFRVRHRPTGAPPAVVYVSGGAIQVMGTRFTVEQQGERGSVTLHEGAIRFQPLEGSSVEVRPGETLRWPREEVPAIAPLDPPAPTVAPPAALSPKPAPAPAPDRAPAPRPAHTPSPSPRIPDVEEVLHEVEVLRSRGEYQKAARELEVALHQQPAATREILSFELGSLLSNQLHDRIRACAHWSRHQRTYRGGRYAQEVTRAQETLRCGARDEGARP